MKQNQKIRRARLFTLAALVVVLMSNVYVGRAEEEPFGSITKLWEIPAPWSSSATTGEILIDTNKNYWLMKVSDTVLKVFNLNDGSLKKTLIFSDGIMYYKFIENKNKFVIYTGYNWSKINWNNPRFELYDSESWTILKTVPFRDSTHNVSVSDDGSLLLSAKRNYKEQPYLYIYNFKDMLLQDSIHLEEGTKFGYPIQLPILKISPDNSKIFTRTSYMKWQILPDATVYFVYDTKTKDTILRQAWESYTEDVISNDWKYLYVSEYFDNGKNTNLNKIMIDNEEKIVFKLNFGLNRPFLSDNNKYFIFNLKEDYQKLDLLNGTFSKITNWPKANTFGFLYTIKDSYVFSNVYPNLICFKINDSSLTNLFDKNFTEDTLYPNPTNNQITINNIITAGKTFKMTNITGNELPILNKMQITDNSISIDMTNFISGTYYLNISDKTSSKTYKILKI